jgi:hypothetical protein
MVLESGFPVCGFDLVCGGCPFYTQDLIWVYGRRLAVCDILEGRHCGGVACLFAMLGVKVLDWKRVRRDEVKWWSRSRTAGKCRLADSCLVDMH